MKLWAVGMTVVAASAIFAGQAFGDTVTLTYVGSASPGLSSGLWVDSGGSNPTSADAMAVGSFKWTVSAETGATFTVGQTLNTFCIQLSQGILSGSVYTVSSLSGSPSGGTEAGAIDAVAASQIQGLVNKYYTALDFNSSKPAYSFNSTSYTDGEVAAAMQLAIWEIEYDGGTPGETYGSATNYFTAGTLRASGSTSSGTNAITLAKGWLNSFTADSALSSLALTNANKQDQLVGIPNPGSGTPNPVPLPAAFPAGVAMLGGLAIARKFRRKA